MHNAKYKKRAGDRKDGRWLRTYPALNQFMPFIMPERNDAMNFFSDKFEITKAERWIRLKRQEGYPGIGLAHIIIAAYVRTVSQMPGINRFVAGQRVFVRYDIEVNMMVKKGISVESEETLAKMHFEPTDTVFDVYRTMNSAVDEILSSPSDTGTERFAKTFLKLPRPILRLAVWALRKGDYYGLLGKSLLDISPFHGSVIFTDLGSLGIPPVYHHLYNFGNLPTFIAFGAKRNAYEVDKEGNLVHKRYVDYKVVIDERICDGAYFAAAFRYFKYYVNDPSELESPPQEVKVDIP